MLHVMFAAISVIAQAVVFLCISIISQFFVEMQN